MAVPRVFAAILNWNGFPLTVRCAESLLRSEGVHVSLVVVDNASPDGSGERLRELLGPERIIQTGVNRGYAGGMNAALKRWLECSDAEFGLLLTQDVVLQPDTVLRLLEAGTEHARIGIVGPVVYYHEDPDHGATAGGYLDTRRAIAGPRTTIPDTAHDVEWLDGGCLLLRREMVEKIGGFDERYFMYFEENDFCQRVRRADWRVRVAPEAQVWHDTAPLPGAHYYYYMSRNSFLFWRENFEVNFFRVARLLVGEAARLGLRAAADLAFPKRRGQFHNSLVRFRLHGRGVAQGMHDYLRGRLGRQRLEKQ